MYEATGAKRWTYHKYKCLGFGFFRLQNLGAGWGALMSKWSGLRGFETALRDFRGGAKID